jgi:hypothetical protein
MKKKLPADPSFELAEFSFELDPEATHRFLEVLQNEGLIKAGFVIHEANNASVLVTTERGRPSQGGAKRKKDPKGS